MARSILAALLIGCVGGFAAADGNGWVGITVSSVDFTIISAVAPDGPAAHAGVQVGDRVVEVNGHPTVGLTRDEFIELTSGPPQTDLELELQRAGQAEMLQIRLRRIAAPTPTPPLG